MQQIPKQPVINAAEFESVTGDTGGNGVAIVSLSDDATAEVRTVAERSPDKLHQQSDTREDQTNHGEEDRTRLDPDDQISEITPASVFIPFETGNPETGATTSGVLEVGKISGNVATILVESVPGLMTSPDFCMFVRPFIDTILHFRPLRLKTERNRYIVIMKFKEASDSSKFAQVYQGKHFLHGLVQESCHVREIRSITFEKTNETEATGFPSSVMFPREDEDALRAQCAVCLERLDAKNEALITTFCNHTMHAACLSKVDLNKCPVCRHSHELRPEASACMICNDRSDIWMCAVCGFVGCGIYKKAHAHAHFDETQHPFAINLEDRTFWGGETLRAGSVWDYISERFVNRLLTSDDGKVVEVAQDSVRYTGGSSRAATDAACCSAENVGIVEDEENDRGYQAAVYASRMDAIVDDYRARLERMEAERAAEKNGLEDEIKRLKEALAKGAKEKRNLQKRLGETEKEAKNLEDKNGFLKNLSDTLLRNNHDWNDQVERLKKQLAESEKAKVELEEEIRDLMMHLGAQAKISEASGSCRSGPSELQGGDVRVGPSLRQRLAMKTNRR